MVQQHVNEPCTYRACMRAYQSLTSERAPTALSSSLVVPRPNASIGDLVLVPSDEAKKQGHANSFSRFKEAQII
jgi:hypothetical protein